MIKLLISKLYIFLKDHCGLATTILTLIILIFTIKIFIVTQNIGKEASKISLMQLEVNKKVISPIIDIEVKYKRNNAPHWPEDEIVEIRNNGNYLLDLRLHQIAFVTIYISTEAGPIHGKNIIIPVNKFYYKTPKNEKLGLLFTLERPGNNKRLNDLNNDFHKYLKEKGLFGSIGILRYIKLSYKNILNDNETKYFIAKPTKQLELSENEGEDFINLFNIGARKYGFDDFYVISPDKIFSVWKAINSDKTMKTIFNIPLKYIY